LSGLSPKELVSKGEHEQEWGGYFVVKGHERILRMISATRKNYPMTVQRDVWKRRGKLFTDKGVFIRCVKEDMTATNNVLHYLSNGTMRLMFNFKKILYVFPLMLVLKALINCTDSYIYEQLVQGLEGDIYYKDRIVLMLRQLQDEGLYTHEHVRNFIGRNFRAKFTDLPKW
jgi:DNA-directed RNA polymerase I subunit RPA2